MQIMQKNDCYLRPACLKRRNITKILLVMKLTIILLTAAFISGYAHTSAQSITFSGKDIPLKRVFNTIKQQTGYVVFTSKEILAESKPVSVSVSNMPLIDFLDFVLKNQLINYRIENKTIMLSRRLHARIQAISLPSVESHLLFPPPVDVTILVQNVDGHPLEGASIRVKGTQRGVTTDVSGHALLKSIAPNVTLVISFTGYSTVEIPANNNNMVTVKLTAIAQSLEDIVVVGYGTVRKRDLTTSISTLSSNEVMKTPITTVEQALQGNAAGVMVVNTTGEPGGDVSIRVRGGSSIKADNEPLLVIDGFTSDAGLSSINPSDIKSIEILKDAGATAIYGSRGANGVILVTTKSGLIGQPKVTFESYYGIQQTRRRLSLLNAEQLTQLQNDANIAIGKAPVSTMPDTMQSGIDWQDKMLRIAPQLSNTISVSGGDNKVRYYVSANYLNQNGIIVNSGFSRASLRSNLDFNFNSHIKAGINLNLAQTLKNGIQQGDGGSVLRADMTSPIQKFGLDASGSFFIDPTTGEPTVSPLANAYETHRSSKNQNIYAGGYLQFDIAKGLIFRTTGTYNPSNSLNTYYFPNTIAGTKVSDAYEQSLMPTKWTNANTLLYSKVIKNHSFTLLAGQEMTNSFTNNFQAENTDFSTDIFSFYNLSSGNGVPATTSSAVKYTLLSYFGRATYNYNDRYLFAFTYRADGSSKFGTDHKWGYFPAGSFAWRASNERFIKNLNLFDDLKFRFDYGVNGSDRIDPYSSLALYTTLFSSIGNSQQTGYMISRLANPDLKWETTKEYDFGTDLSVLKGRVSLTADYYIKKTSDLLLDYGLPAASGYTTVAKNVGSVENKGVEFAITSRNLIHSFIWTTTFNAAINRNRVLDLGGPSQIAAISNSAANTKFGNVALIKVGDPLGEFWGYKTDGIFQTQDEINKTPAKLEGTKTLPGFQKFVDVNGDGILNDNDKIVLGNPQPKWFGGMTNNFSYKNFDLTVFITYQQGNSIMNSGYAKLFDLSGGNNQIVKALDRWRPADPTTGDLGNSSNKVPRAYATGYTVAMSDAYIEDGSYVRLKTLTLAYNLSGKVLRKLNLSGVRIYATGTNLLTSTKYDGYDPEVSIMGKNSVGAGIDNGAYPTTKMYILGLTLRF